MKLPKLNLVAGTDDFREPMQHIYVNDKHVVATNGSILVMHDRSLLYFIESLPNCFIHHTEWVELTKDFETAKFVESESIVLLTDKKGKKRVVTVIDSNKFNYPNYEAVIPNEDNATDLPSIGVNPSLFVDAMSACTNEKNAIFELIFTGTGRAIIAKPRNTESIEGVKAIIMPCIIPD